ncbi:MAG: hypothetical protein ACLTTZ_04425 [Lachnospiraceae bacterium]
MGAWRIFWQAFGGAGKPERYGIRIVNLSVGAKADLDAGKEQEF